MPLVWSHAEFLKLSVARERGRPVEWLDGIERHFGHRAIARSNERVMSDASRARGAASLWHWREEVPVVRLPRGKTLAIEDRVPSPCTSEFDGWQRVEDRRAERTPFGLWSVMLSREELAQARELNFTRRYESHWENFRPSRRARHPGGGCLASAAPGCTATKRCMKNKRKDCPVRAEVYRCT